MTKRNDWPWKDRGEVPILRCIGWAPLHEPEGLVGLSADEQAAGPRHRLSMVCSVTGRSFESVSVYTWQEIAALKTARCLWCRMPHRFVDLVNRRNRGAA